MAQSKPASKIAPAAAMPSQPQAQPQAPQHRNGPAPDLIDFFESIEQNQQPMAQQTYSQDQQTSQGFPQAQIYGQQLQSMPQQTGYNPFMQKFSQQPQQQAQLQTQPQALQPDFTGAGFGGYGPQPQQPQNYAFNSTFTSIPEGNTVEFPQQAMQPPPQTQISQAEIPQTLQPQVTGTNPFRQSMMQTGSGQPFQSAGIQRQSTNPFAKQTSGTMLDQVVPQPTTDYPQQQQPLQQQYAPMQQEPYAQHLQPQKTGTNPFARTANLSPSPAMPLTANVTGSTNPFRQSQFVNQQTRQGWQHSAQGTFGGVDVNGVPTTSVFPRPGA